MDLNAEKLIDRKGLLKYNFTLEKIIENANARLKAQEEKSDLLLTNAKSWEELYKKSEAQISLLNTSLANQVQITTNTKRKARKNGLLMFGGGVTVGVVGLILLTK